MKPIEINADGMITTANFKMLRYTASAVVDHDTLDQFRREFEKAYNCMIPTQTMRSPTCTPTCACSIQKTGIKLQELVDAVYDGNVVRVLTKLSVTRVNEAVVHYKTLKVWAIYHTLLSGYTIIMYEDHYYHV